MSSPQILENFNSESKHPGRKATMRFVSHPFKSALMKRATTVAAYACAMAYLESAVVVYLQRALAMTPATLFPLREQTTLGGLGSIEVGREVATLVMLVAVGWLAGRTFTESLAWTALAFGIWDIGYYFWLWIFLDWPTSLGTTDLLFLLPVPWVAPIWAPILISVALIFFGILVLRNNQRGKPLVLLSRDWTLLIAGGLVVIASFTLDAGRVRDGGMPAPFAWPVFSVGLMLALLGIWRPLRISKNAN